MSYMVEDAVADSVNVGGSWTIEGAYTILAFILLIIIVGIGRALIKHFTK